MATASATASATSAKAAQQAQEVQKKKNELLEFIKEWLRRIFLGKPQFYKAMEEIQNNLEELTLQNVLTTEALENMYNLVYEAKGDMEHFTVQAAKDLTDRLNAQIDEAKEQLNSIKSVDEILYEGGKLQSNIGVFRYGEDIYLAKKDKDNNIEGSTAYKLSIRQNDNKKEIQANLTVIDKKKDDFVEVNSIASTDPVFDEMVGGDRIKAIVALEILGEEQGKETALQITQYRSARRNLSQMQHNNKVMAHISDLETEDDKYKTGFDEQNRFYIADKDAGKMIYFTSEKDIDRAIECDCTRQGVKKEKGDSKVIATWSRSNLEGDKSVIASYTYDKELIAYKMMQSPAAQTYLDLRALGNLDRERIEHKTEAQQQPRTKQGTYKIRKYIEAMKKDLPDYKVEATGSSVIIQNPNSAIKTEIAFSGNGTPEVILQSEGEGKEFKKYGKIDAKLVKAVAFNNTEEYQKISSAFVKAAEELENENYLKKEGRYSDNILQNNDKLDRSVETTRNVLNRRNNSRENYRSDIASIIQPEQPSLVNDNTIDTSINNVNQTDKRFVVNSFEDLMSLVTASNADFRKAFEENDISVRSVIDTVLKSASEEQQLQFAQTANEVYSPVLYNSEYPTVRATLASRSDGTNAIFVNDTDERVRIANIQGLLNAANADIVQQVEQYKAKNPESQATVDQIVNTENSAWNTQAKNIASTERSAYVLGYLAKQGLAVSALATNSDPSVRLAVIDGLKAPFIKEQEKREILDTLRKDTNADIQKSAKDMIKELDKSKSDKSRETKEM